MFSFLLLLVFPKFHVIPNLSNQNRPSTLLVECLKRLQKFRLIYIVDVGCVFGGEVWIISHTNYSMINYMRNGLQGILFSFFFFFFLQNNLAPLAYIYVCKPLLEHCSWNRSFRSNCIDYRLCLSLHHCHYFSSILPRINIH